MCFAQGTKVPPPLRQLMFTREKESEEKRGIKASWWPPWDAIQSTRRRRIERLQPKWCHGGPTRRSSPQGSILSPGPSSQISCLPLPWFRGNSPQPRAKRGVRKDFLYPGAMREIERGLCCTLMQSDMDLEHSSSLLLWPNH